MKAIAVPYCDSQNEPSRPLKMIVDLPDDEKDRNSVITSLFKEHVFSSEDEDIAEEIVIREGKKGDYGDLIASYEDEVFLYFTFI